MEATIVLILFLTFLVGGMMLALVMGYRSIEESRLGQTLEQPHARAETVARTIAVPSFLPRAGVVPPVPSITFDDALLARLERHVRAEQALVSQFVRFPSVDSLYSRSSTSLRAH
jgi:hypothetical protein